MLGWRRDFAFRRGSGEEGVEASKVAGLVSDEMLHPCRHVKKVPGTQDVRPVLHDSRRIARKRIDNFRGRMRVAWQLRTCCEGGGADRQLLRPRCAARDEDTQRNA